MQNDLHHIQQQKTQNEQFSLQTIREKKWGDIKKNKVTENTEKTNYRTFDCLRLTKTPTKTLTNTLTAME